MTTGCNDASIRMGGAALVAAALGFIGVFAYLARGGFTPHVRREVFAQLKPSHTDRCPFVDLPNGKMSHWGAGVTAEEMDEMQWLRPKLVAQVRFVESTAEGYLRHPAFLGLRSDKKANAVRRET